MSETKTESKTHKDTYTCFRVVGPWGTPTKFVYAIDLSPEEIEKLYEEQKKTGKVYGPFEQWNFIRDNGLTPGDLEDCDRWAAGYGITGWMLNGATKESRRQIIMDWYKEKMKAKF